MNGLQGIKRQLLPLLKGSPIIVVCALIAFAIARKVISYTPNTYQVIAKIKLDDQKYGFSNTQLYKDFDVFSTTSKVQSEAEILSSPLLIQNCLNKLDFGISIYRVGQLKNTLLYHDSPIIIQHDFTKAKNLDVVYWIKVVDQGHYQIGLLESELDTTETEKTPFGSPVMFRGESITVLKNDSLLDRKELDLIGLYEAEIFSRDGLLLDVKEKLSVAAVDKEIPVLRVVYKEQHPEKAAVLANALCREYIHDYVSTKTGAAGMTVKFLDQKIEEVSNELKRAEIRLERYKAENGVVNTRQETETGLRQQSDLEVQLINLEMNEKAILALEEYMTKGDYFNETAINFGFGDLLMTELVKKLKMYQDERQDLVFKYTAESDQVRAVDAKILEVKKYIKEAIQRNKKEIEIKREAIEKTVEVNAKQFDGLSTREKEMRVLERDFALKEQIYTFLAEKKIEASIAESAVLSFHRIIQEAIVPSSPVSPNKTLITFVSTLLGIILGISYVLLRKVTLSRITTREDLEKHSDLPILGVVRKKNSDADISNLAKAIKYKHLLKEKPLITVASSIQGEGRTFVSRRLAGHVASFGYSVALVDLREDCLSPDLDGIQGKTGEVSSIGLKTNVCSELEGTLEILKSAFDVVIFDSPACAIAIEGVEWMQQADLNLFIFRADFTSTSFIEYPELLADEYGIKNLQLLLNASFMASSYNGRFYGTAFNKGLARQDVFAKLKTYFLTYVGQ